MIKIKTLSENLKRKISVYSPSSFIGKMNFMMQIHHKNRSELISDKKSDFYLNSPARQLIYLSSLYLSIEEHGEEILDQISQTEIFKTLNLIEEEYKNIYTSELESRQNEFDDEQFKKLLITSSTFLDYFQNSELNYIEQDIERIKDIFNVYDDFIERETGLKVSDFLSFFDSTIKISFIKEKKWDNILKSKGWYEMISDIPNLEENDFKLKYPDQSVGFYDYLENPSVFLSFRSIELYGFQNFEHVEKLLNYFSIESESKDYLYYAHYSSILLKPIIKIGDNYYFFFHKNLSKSIYLFLFDLCKGLDINSERIYRQRDQRLERKVEQVFKNFFPSDSRVIKNYIYKNDEKDLLVLFRKMALIIEVKANRKNEPFRDINKCYTRIKRDFTNSIQKGYDQTYSMKEAFNNQNDFEIKTESGDFTINPRRYSNVFSIVVTEERLGQIQTDLGLLLNVVEDDVYPWSISIDDLEVFFLTLGRKKNKISELVTFLNHRELLHERVVCNDELELCSYFFMDRKHFIDGCNSEGVFISSPDLSNFFDDIYYSGMGFKNEIGISNKLKNTKLVGHRLAEKFGLEKIRLKKNLYY